MTSHLRFFLPERYAGAMTEQICRNLEKLDRAKITLESQDVTQNGGDEKTPLLLMAEILLPLSLVVYPIIYD